MAYDKTRNGAFFYVYTCLHLVPSDHWTVTERSFSDLKEHWTLLTLHAM